MLAEALVQAQIPQHISSSYGCHRAFLHSISKYLLSYGEIIPNKMSCTNKYKPCDRSGWSASLELCGHSSPVTFGSSVCSGSARGGPRTEKKKIGEKKKRGEERREKPNPLTKPSNG